VVDALEEESFAVIEPGSWLKPAQFSFTQPMAIAPLINPYR